ncbi:MAG: STAS domain-containing protein [Boseongicola sp.]|nr:MAG: STAS domain-containing protein [Boseongicola sp.]
MQTEIPEQTNATDKGVIVLPPKMDTAAAGNLHRILSENAGQDLTLDTSQTEMLGARCLEVLLNARHHWAARGHSIEMTPPGKDMLGCLTRFGLTPDALATGETP